MRKGTNTLGFFVNVEGGHNKFVGEMVTTNNLLHPVEASAKVGKTFNDTVPN